MLNLYDYLTPLDSKRIENYITEWGIEDGYVGNDTYLSYWKENKKKLFSVWVKQNLESPVPELVECAKTYQHWAYEIKNSLEVPYSNGPIEGTNNKIKALKRVTFGMTNFENFKARIMLLN